MAAGAELPVDERILQLLRHLGILQAHFAASNPVDWQGLVAAHPEVVSSLTLITPRAVDPAVASAVAPRLLVFNGDRGNPAEALQRSMAGLPDANIAVLQDYQRSNSADVIANRWESIGPTVIEFLGRMNESRHTGSVTLVEGQGEVAGISYRVRGSGPPLILLPIEYASSQWEPLVPTLAQHYSTATLGGSWLGVVANLEARAQGDYLEAVRKVVNETRLLPGERVLDVGCGSGSLDRWLAQRTRKANPIMAVDHSAYLLREAATLARSEGLEEAIEFREARAEALPFPDSSFDVSMSFTVISFGDADLMLSEMVRVTRPGGWIAVLTGGYDRPTIINLPLRAELKTKAEAPRGGASDGPGCADASLYRRFYQAGLTQVRMLPQLANNTDKLRLRFMEAEIFTNLTPEEMEEWQAAVSEAEAEGTFFIAELYHCAVGTIPG